MTIHNPNVITVREYDRLSLGKRWDANARTIDEETAARIFHHQEVSGRRLFEPVYKGFKATQWVGALGLGHRCLEVVPKIDDPGGREDDRRARENLFWMVASAGLVPVTPTDISFLSDPSRPLLIAFLELYVDQLSVEWQRGPIRQYVVEEENRTFLRGKLLFPEQLRHNLVQQQQFYTQADEFTMDNPLSRLLKAALRCCAFQSFSDQVARKARALLLEFAEVCDQEFSEQETERIEVSRQHARFSLLVNLARMILKSSSPDSAGSGHPVFSLMFDMNAVFERFVAAELSQALAGTSLAVVPQLGGKSLLKEKGRARFHLRPDIGIKQGDKIVCLIDTKWKRLDPNLPHCGVSQADIYQMYAYGKEYDVPVTILLYPQHRKLAKEVTRYCHIPKHLEDEEGKEIRVSTLDVSSPLWDGSSRLALRESLLALLSEHVGENKWEEENRYLMI